MTQRQVRLAGTSGLAFVVLFLVAAFLPAHPPGFQAGADEVRAFWADQRDAVLAATLLTALASTALAVFAAAFDSRVARTGAVAFLVLYLGSTVVTAAPVVDGTAVAALGDDLVLTVWLSQSVAAGCAALLLALTAVAVGVAGTQRWVSLPLGALAAVLGADGVLNPFDGRGVLALFVLCLWALVVAGGMAFRGTRPGTSALSGTSQGVEL